MCCIFTFAVWMIDLVQRLWVFAMSCCISSAVCCVLMTGSVSGVAMGYNYSLAEFIGSKETNVSVYVKRGIFDDEAGDEDDWRRSGHKSMRGLVRDDGDLITAPSNDEEGTTPRSGRRLDDSIMESNDQNKFEGSLMKLTAKPPFPLTTITPVTSDAKMEKIISQYPKGSLDQLKAIQSLIGMRKAEALRDTTVKGMEKSTYDLDDRYVPNITPGLPMDEYRRMMNGPPRYPSAGAGHMPEDINPARYAVPDSSINEMSKWMGPKYPKMYRKSNDYEERRTYPRPVIYKPGPIRPTRPKTEPPSAQDEPEPEPSPMEPATARVLEVTRSRPGDLGVDEFREKLILDKYESPRSQDDKLRAQKGGPDKSILDYYEEDIKGLPVRRKRDINRIKRKVASVGHEKLNLPEKMGKVEENSNILNEITNPPSVLVGKLLFYNNSPLRESYIAKKNVGDSSSSALIIGNLLSMFS